MTSTRSLDELAVKHLEFLQAVINRLSHECFAYKGWAVTMVAAIYAVATASGNAWLVPVALVPALLFWGLDAYYLRQQRLFRVLYDAVRDGSAEALEGGPLSMDVAPYADQASSWFGACLAKSVAVPYGALVMLTWTVLAFTLQLA